MPFDETGHLRFADIPDQAQKVVHEFIGVVVAIEILRKPVSAGVACGHPEIPRRRIAGRAYRPCPVRLRQIRPRNSASNLLIAGAEDSAASPNRVTTRSRLGMT